MHIYQLQHNKTSNQSGEKVWKHRHIVTQQHGISPQNTNPVWLFLVTFLFTGRMPHRNSPREGKFGPCVGMMASITVRKACAGFRAQRLLVTWCQQEAKRREPESGTTYKLQSLLLAIMSFREAVPLMSSTTS